MSAKRPPVPSPSPFRIVHCVNVGITGRRSGPIQVGDRIKFRHYSSTRLQPSKLFAFGIAQSLTIFQIPFVLLQLDIKSWRGSL